MNNAARILLGAVSLGLLILSSSCQGEPDESEPPPATGSDPVRPPAVAGQFYPGDAAGLARDVDRYLAAVPALHSTGTPVAVMVPHAGYMFSAQTAAYVYKLLADRKIAHVILLGNSHRFPVKRGAVVVRGSFQTPLGKVRINQVLAEKILAGTPRLEANARPHEPEHSLEVQLPFLQRTQKDFDIVPILLGQASLDQCREIGEAIAAAVAALGIAESTVLIDSTDMSHYPTWSDANKADKQALAALEKFDPLALQQAIGELMAAGLPNEQCVFCGEESLYTTLFAARAMRADQVKVLHYANSGDVTGDKGRVVGYGAAVFLKTVAAAPDPAGRNATADKTTPGVTNAGTRGSTFRIEPQQQQALLRIARQSVDYYLVHDKEKEVRSDDPALNVPGAVFVTLTKNGELRGCIGTLEPQGALCQVVNRYAVAAAFEDHRFAPVTAAEWKDIHIEISVLSPMVRAGNADEIQPKVHGVVVQRGRRNRGVFLPQVWEHFSGKEDFMGELCRQKAGLPRDAWKDPATELYLFTVFAFEEERK